jgi:hypothetical protein
MDLPDYLTDMDGEQGRQAEEEVGPRGAHDVAVRCQMGNMGIDLLDFGCRASRTHHSIRVDRPTRASAEQSNGGRDPVWSSASGRGDESPCRSPSGPL